MNNYANYLYIAIRAALDAGKAIMDIYTDPESDFGIERKADNSPLTKADKKAHAIISMALSVTPFPVLSEEGKEIPFAIATLKQLQAERHLLILWSVREGKLLEEAVEFCRKRGVEFYAVNANHPDEQVKPDMTSPCRKVKADLYIDDLNVGKLPDWGAIYEMIHNRWSYELY